jgi:hypothetical protein
LIEIWATRKNGNSGYILTVLKALGGNNMALDHYVSQVHLRNFYSPMLVQHMYAMRKSDLQSFPCNSRSVCRIEEGSTNAYLINDRSIEAFLLDVEPRYNSSVTNLRDNKIDKECIHAIAGFAAYVACCAPAAMRIHAEPLKSLLESEAAILDKQGLIPKAPPSLGSKTLTELLADKEVTFSIDSKYPQALGINTIIERVSIFGNSKWEILLNGVPECPFFTSDFPMAIEATGYRTMNWIVPLTPALAIRIIPDIRLSGIAPDLSFAKFTSRQRTLRRSEIVEINRLIVQCAEDLVFYRDDHIWIGDFVAKNRYYRIEAVTDRIRYGTGFRNISTQRIVQHQGGCPRPRI